jgi:hypothetical protein
MPGRDEAIYAKHSGKHISPAYWHRQAHLSCHWHGSEKILPGTQPCSIKREHDPPSSARLNCGSNFALGTTISKPPNEAGFDQPYRKDGYCVQFMDTHFGSTFNIDSCLMIDYNLFSVLSSSTVNFLI